MNPGVESWRAWRSEGFLFLNEGTKAFGQSLKAPRTIGYEKHMWLSFAPLRPENKGGKQRSGAGEQAVVPSRRCVMGKEPSQHEIVAIFGFHCRRPEIISIAFQWILWIIIIFKVLWSLNMSQECDVLLLCSHPRFVCDHIGLVGTNTQTEVWLQLHVIGCCCVHSQSLKAGFFPFFHRWTFRFCFHN